MQALFIISYLLIVCLMASSSSSSLVKAPSFPKLSVPVYSLATRHLATGKTNFNIVTYANQVSIGPVIWSLSLYKNTASFDSFLENPCGVLQLLKQDIDPEVVRLLGKTSGKEVDKMAELERLGVKLRPLFVEALGQEICIMEELVEACVVLSQRGRGEGEKSRFDAGDHELILCDPIEYFVNEKVEPMEPLTTGHLRDLEVI